MRTALPQLVPLQLPQDDRFKQALAASKQPPPLLEVLAKKTMTSGLQRTLCAVVQVSYQSIGKSRVKQSRNSNNCGDQ